MECVFPISNQGVDLYYFRGEGESPGGIRTIHPECAEGLVQWKHPYGAFRLIFTEPYATSFETCFIAQSVNMTIKISEETSGGLKPLTLLNSKKTVRDDSDKEICVKSSGREAIVIFIEAVLDTMSGVGTFQLFYDTRTYNTGDMSTGKSINGEFCYCAYFRLNK